MSSRTFPDLELTGGKGVIFVSMKHSIAVSGDQRVALFGNEGVPNEGTNGTACTSLKHKRNVISRPWSKFVGMPVFDGNRKHIF